MDCIARIEKHRNGYEISINDPKIVAENRKKRDSKDYTPWRDPMVSYVFKTVEELTTFLSENLAKAVPEDDTYASSFDKAVAAMDEED